ncbi:MAG: class I SAM-dependent methyltransferase [bacterium]
MAVDLPDHQAIYDKGAAQWDAGRAELRVEAHWVGEVMARLPQAGRVLDVGCGSGRPIAAAFLAAGYQLCGVDFAPGMLALAKARFPAADWRLADMRRLALDDEFDAVIAWDSLFHLTAAEQRVTLPRLAAHLRPGGWLLFTSGPAAGEAWGWAAGAAVWHASLDPAEYREICAAAGLADMIFVAEDPLAGGHSVWLGQKE